MPFLKYYSVNIWCKSTGPTARFLLFKHTKQPCYALTRAAKARWLIPSPFPHAPLPSSTPNRAWALDLTRKYSFSYFRQNRVNNLYPFLRYSIWRKSTSCWFCQMFRIFRKYILSHLALAFYAHGGWPIGHKEQGCKDSQHAEDDVG